MANEVRRRLVVDTSSARKLAHAVEDIIAWVQASESHRNYTIHVTKRKVEIIDDGHKLYYTRYDWK